MQERENLIFLPRVGSTNTELKKLALRGAPHGTVLCASSQTDGRGRMGRSFASPEGGLYLSMLLRPELPPPETLGIMPSAAAALCLCLDGIGVRAGIKWPNDILLGGKKLAGILTEGFTDTSGRFGMILGVGLNVNTRCFPEELADIAVSLYLHGGGTYSIPDLALRLTASLDDMFAAYSEDRRAYLGIYRERCLTPGKTVTLPGGGSALALGINDDFSLSLERDGRPFSLGWGELL